MAAEFAPIHIVALFAGYLIGSVPFGLVLTRMAGLGDIREIGSGNIGATNVLRTGNKPLALATLLLDTGKGAVAALALTAIDPLAGLIGGGAAILGHNFPVWLKFKGGKGVATTLGVLIAVAWPVGLGACVTWLLTAIIFRYSSLAALVGLSASPFYAWWLALPEVAILAALLALLSIVRHHENITRLIKGEESKIGKKKAE
ncbi:MAG: glycerol-3-phosphate 1-O-acyltransferase PlsY [Rhodospirillaceae bacterium]|jgi:acyl phosphate:glycerol-3-phosphate acyltransferase|nr:glycerol-3-phosphate 1-O-acyltransferase PlsY [Rhodospirillaceae bacterium]